MNGKDVKLEKILEVSLKVFARFGYKKATMEDIATELGMTKGNIYLYVRDKRDLYEKSVSHALVKWQSRVFEQMSAETDVIRQFSVMSNRAFEYLAGDVDLHAILVNDQSIFPISFAEDRFREINKASMDMVRELIRRGIREKKFRKIDVESAVEFIFSVYIMFIIKTYVKHESRPTETMFSTGLDMLLNGLVAR